MDLLWHTFGWSMGVGLPIFAALCWLSRARVRSSWQRRLILSLVLALAITPTGFTPHGPLAVFAAIWLLPAAFHEPFLGLVAGIPIVVGTLLVFAVWSVALKLAPPKHEAA